MIPRPRDGREPAAAGQAEEPTGRLADDGREPGPHPDPAPAEDPTPDVTEPGPHPDPPPGTTDPEDGGEDRAAADMMRLLGEHVPLTLLADLAERDGPPSPGILEKEGLPEVAWWETDSR